MMREKTIYTRKKKERKKERKKEKTEYNKQEKENIREVVEIKRWGDWRNVPGGGRVTTCLDIIK